MTNTRPRSGAVLAVLVLLVLAACGGTEANHAAATSSPTPKPTTSVPDAPRQGDNYVALGDSYTAGGPITSLQQDGSRCQRSAVNYPSIVARTLDLPLTDVSCISATTGNLLKASSGLPAQVDAITSRTRTVTVGIGGNDFGLYGRLILTCSNVSEPGDAGAACRDRLAPEVASDVPAIGDRVGNVLAEVRRRAPDAKVVLVGYPRLMPVTGTCTDVPYSTGDVAWISSLEADLSTTLARAARTAGATFVSMYERSKGHDLCSDRSWVNGLDPARGDGIVLHPNAAGERAMADAVAASLR